MKNLNEELNRMQGLMSFDISQNSHDVLSESNVGKSLLYERTTFVGDGGDKIYYVTFNKKGKPKLKELGVIVKKDDKFLLLPTKYFFKVFKKYKKSPSIPMDTLKDDVLFSGFAKRDIKTSYGREPLILRDYEIDEFIDVMTQDNKRYEEIVEKRIKEIEGTVWNGNSGTFILDGPGGTSVNALNIKGPENNINGRNTYNGVCSEVKGFQIGAVKTPDTKTSGGTATLYPVKVNDITDVYCDNMVQPNIFTDGPAKKEFDYLVSLVVDYILSPDDDSGVSALSKLDNITILGQADSAAPGWAPGSPCNTVSKKIDHDYGGMKKKAKKDRTKEDLIKMNTYLAKYRAINYKNDLINSVKEETKNMDPDRFPDGATITIKELPPKQYYNESGKRGSEWRSIELNFNAPTHTWTIKEGEDYKESTLSQRIINFEKTGYKYAFVAINNGKGGKDVFESLYDKSSGNVYLKEIPSNIDIFKDSEGNILPLEIKAMGNIYSKVDVNPSELKPISVLNQKSFSVNCELNFPNLNIGEYKVKLMPGGSSMMKVITQKALAKPLVSGCMGAKESQFMFSNGFYGGNDNKYNCYDKGSGIKVLNENFYLLKQYGFIFADISCSNTGFEPTIPTREQILTNFIKDKPIYTQKQIDYLNKKFK